MELKEAEFLSGWRRTTVIVTACCLLGVLLCGSTAPGTSYPRQSIEGQTSDSGASPTSIGAKAAGDVLWISGMVVDKEGRPVSSVKVGAYQEGGHGASLPSSTTGRDGGFRLGPVAPGQYALYASNNAYTSAPFGRVIAQAGHADARIVVRQRERINGRVLDVHKVPIQLFSLNGIQVEDADGYFAVPASIASETRGVAVGALGYFPVVRTARVTKGSDIEFGEFVLGVGRLLLVHVVAAEDKKSIDGAEIVQVLGRVGDPPTVLGVTDGTGASSIRGFRGPSEIVVRAPGFSPKQIRLEGPETEVGIALERGPRLQVHSRNAAGVAEGSKIALISRDDGRIAEIVSSGKNGDIDIDSISPGRWVLVGRSYGTWEMAWTTVELGQHDMVETTLVFGDAAVSIEVRVESPIGWNVVDVDILPSAIGRGGLEGVDGELGLLVLSPVNRKGTSDRFSIDALKAGLYDVVVTVENERQGGRYAWPIRIVEAGTRSFVVPAPRTDQIRLVTH